MPRDAAFMQRTLQNYHAMRQRFGAKKWKSGKRTGMLRSAGQELPFSLDQYREWMVEELGGRPDGTCRCRYCPAIMTALDFGADHIDPVAQGGSLDFSNMAPCCKSCNRYKGKLSEKGFLAFKFWLDSEIGKLLTIADVADIEQRMKGGGASYKKDYRKGKSVPLPRETQLPLEEPF
jgi:hypothetical protein